MDLWLHGTNEYFEKWCAPPISSKYKFELLPHSFISLSKDRCLAEQAGAESGGLCGAHLLPHSRVLDLRVDSVDAKKHWELVRDTELGQKHLLCRTYPLWRRGCSTGELLRMMTDDPELGNYYDQLIHISSPNGARTLQEAQRAHVEVQNFTRLWIETVVSPAKSLGYDAVICCEFDRFRKGGFKSCVNLHVFSPNAISDPVWLSNPDEARMTEFLKGLRAAGIVKT